MHIPPHNHSASFSLSEMAAMTENMTELGFVEKADSYRLQSIFFPSKIGGKPAWLSHENIPPAVEIKCPKCGGVMIFLLQIYAPRDGQEDTFHRMIYVFMCGNSECFEKNSNTPFKIFRNQIPRENKFFDYDAISPDAEEGDVIKIVQGLQANWGSLCNVCGYKADKKCSACKEVGYCSKDHQVIDWKIGHKFTCSGSNKSAIKNQGMKIQGKNTSVLPEFEIVTEPEETEQEEAELRQSLTSSSEANHCETEAEIDTDGAFAELADKQFQKFKTIISKDPEQVLRYRYDGEPIWVSSEHQANPKDIPNCSCGAKRVCEFQILPQLLNYLNLDSINGKSIDFGTLVVYTCENNCQSSTKYSPEFIWKQDFSDVNVKYQ